MKAIKKNFINATMDLIKAFEKKQDVRFQYFIADDITGVADFGDILLFNVSDIWHDLTTEQPKGLIVEWQEANVENDGNFINYKSYCMGLRHNSN